MHSTFIISNDVPSYKMITVTFHSSTLTGKFANMLFFTLSYSRGLIVYLTTISSPFLSARW
jgi:hypothetical protein